MLQKLSLLAFQTLRNRETGSSPTFHHEFISSPPAFNEKIEIFVTFLLKRLTLPQNEDIIYINT